MRFRAADLFTVFVIFVLGGAVIWASHWPLRASIIILALGSLGVVMATAQLLLDMFRREAVGRSARKPTYELPGFDERDVRLQVRGVLEIWAWMIGLVLAVPIVGLPVAVPLFVLTYALFYGADWKVAVLLTALISAFIFGVYNQIMHVYWPDSLLGDWLGG